MPRRSVPVVRICVQLPVSLADRLAAASDQGEVTQVSIIRSALDSWLPAAAPKS